MTKMKYLLLFLMVFCGCDGPDLRAARLQLDYERAIHKQSIQEAIEREDRLRAIIVNKTKLLEQCETPK